MCGIIGTITNAALSRELIQTLHKKQIHRGPDAQDEFLCRHKNGLYISFLHQRLAIIDLETGNQPMSAFDEQLWIIFNGEIFNYQELKSGLQQKGYHFKTKNSDTEILLCLYKEYGAKMLEFLNGMFAFAIYDKANSKIFIARDRTGIKPLLYFADESGFFFASELKTLLELKPGYNVCNQALINYLSFQYIPAPLTILENIFKLPAAHYLLYNIDNKKFEIKKYWDIQFNPVEMSVSEWKKQIFDKINESVTYWTISDVEVAASLSGGLDSSALVGLYAKNSDKKIKTFSLGFEDKGNALNELHLARKVAEKYGSNHFEFILKPDILLKDLQKMVYHLDEPYGGGLPSWYIYQLMSGYVKVAITGTGGDELFGNYVKSKVYSSFINKSLRFVNRNRTNCLREFETLFNFPNAVFYQKCFTGQEIFNDILSKHLDKDTLEFPEKFIEEIISQSPSKIPENFIPYHDFKTQLPEEFLQMTDRFSMAFSIEARVPLLNHELIEMVMNIPAAIRTKHSDTKYLLRESVKELLPQELLYAPKKGFIIPVSDWLRTSLRSKVEQHFDKKYLQNQGIFNPGIYEKIVIPHLNGKKDNSQKLWTLLMFQFWYDKFILNK
jgi:asparagine synthase (glutamine-hydrolysing)